jgi:hypothetical protein
MARPAKSPIERAASQMGLSLAEMQELFLMQSDVTTPCIHGPDRIYVNPETVSTMRVIFAEKLGRPMHECWVVRNLCGNSKCKHPAHHDLAYRWNVETFEPLPDTRVSEFDEIGELIELIERQDSRDASVIHERYPLYTMAEIQTALKKIA